jgi:hypothetical protein
MGIMVFFLLLTIFLLLTAGTAAVITLYKNIGRDMVKVFQIGEEKVHKELQHKQLKNYTIHS